MPCCQSAVDGRTLAGQKPGARALLCASDRQTHHTAGARAVRDPQRSLDAWTASLYAATDGNKGLIGMCLHEVHLARGLDHLWHLMKVTATPSRCCTALLRIIGAS